LVVNILVEMADPFALGLDDDPAADFLAREQQELAGLEDDGFENLSSETTATNLQNGFDALSLDPTSKSLQNGFEAFDHESGSEALQSDFETLAFESAVEEPKNEFEALAFEPADEVTQILNFPIQSLPVIDQQLILPVNGMESTENDAATPQKILMWREEQQKKIAEKDQNEESKMEEWRNTAKRELEEWYSRQAEQVEKHKKNNRVAEAEFVKERDETTPGNEWERISRLCDFNPKNNKNTKDVSKLRSILLQLKQNPLQREQPLI